MVLNHAADILFWFNYVLKKDSFIECYCQCCEIQKRNIASHRKLVLAHWKTQ